MTTDTDTPFLLSDAAVLVLLARDTLNAAVDLADQVVGSGMLLPARVWGSVRRFRERMEELRGMTGNAARLIP